jgi:hypothetical protein
MLLRHLNWIITATIASHIDSAHALYNSTFNPILVPRSNEVIRLGQNFDILWSPTTTGAVSLFLRYFGTTTGNVIADSIEASSGHYRWLVPNALAANTTDNSDPFNFELRIYQGSLGVNTLDVSPFSDRDYTWSSGYFAITNSSTYTTLSSFVATTTTAIGTAGFYFAPTGSVTTTDSTTSTTSTDSTTQDGSNTRKTHASVATRLPTFLTVKSDAVQSERFITCKTLVGMVVCIFLGVMAL